MGAGPSYTDLCPGDTQPCCGEGNFYLGLHHRPGPRQPSRCEICPNVQDPQAGRGLGWHWVSSALGAGRIWKVSFSLETFEMDRIRNTGCCSRGFQIKEGLLESKAKTKQRLFLAFSSPSVLEFTGSSWHGALCSRCCLTCWGPASWLVLTGQPALA